MRNPDYFKKGLPYLDGYIIYVIRDDAARLSALRTGRIHSIIASAFGRVSEEKVLKRDLGDRVVTRHQFHDNAWPVFPLNIKKKPFDDLRVRQAIRMALNNEEYFEIVFEGLGKVTGPVAGPYWALPQEELQKYPGFEPNYEARLAKAKQLLAEAGYPKGFDTELVGVADRWYNKATMEYGNAALKRIGINAKLVLLDTASFYSRLEKADFETAGSNFSTFSGDPDGIFGHFYITGGPRNYSHYSNPKIDEMFEKQARELDPAKRREMVREMQRIVLQDVAFPMFGVRSFIPNRLEFVRGGELDGLAVHFNTRYETLWLAE